MLIRLNASLKSVLWFSQLFQTNLLIIWEYKNDMSFEYVFLNDDY